MMIPADVWCDPEDDPAIFYRKLSCMSKRHLNFNLQKFYQYETYCNILKFQLAACERPETNVRVIYNDTTGWHLSCCLKSIPIYREDYDREACSCKDDISNPQQFFHKLERDHLNRCKLCKRFDPEWEEGTGSKEVNTLNPGKRETETPFKQDK